MLSNDQQRVLRAVLDTIVPPDSGRGMPGAGEIGVATHLSNALEASPDLESTIVAGLEALGASFAGLDLAARVEALNELPSSHAGFVPSLLFHTYQGYYQDPKILEALGMPGRAPHPEGYDMESNDLTLLEPVRAREKLYRDC